MSKFASILKKSVGLSIKAFCEKELKTKYTAFTARMRENRMYAAEVFYIVHRTGKTCEEIFGKSWHELLINKMGNMSDDVLTKIRSLSLEERAQVSGLLGIKESEPVKLYAPAAAAPIAALPPVEQPATEPPVEQPKPEDPFKQLFINTY